MSCGSQGTVIDTGPRSRTIAERKLPLDPASDRRVSAVLASPEQLSITDRSDDGAQR